MHRIARFKFATRPRSSSSRLVASIDRVHGKDELIQALVSGLRIPDWFGWNWDALEDSLRDLSWVTEETVVIHHETVPDLPVQDLRTYLSILDAAAGPRPRGRRPTLEVTFGPGTERVLLAVLEGA